MVCWRQLINLQSFQDFHYMYHPLLSCFLDLLENLLFSMYRHYVDLYLRHKVGEVKPRGGLRPQWIAKPCRGPHYTPMVGVVVVDWSRVLIGRHTIYLMVIFGLFYIFDLGRWAFRALSFPKSRVLPMIIHIFFCFSYDL